MNDMSQARTDTLATIEIPTTAYSALSRCTHFTPTPMAVKRMAVMFTDGISELAEGNPAVLESQYCYKCETEKWTEDLNFRAEQFEPRYPPRYAHTSDPTTPTYLADEDLGPVIRKRDTGITLKTMYSDAGPTIDKKVASLFSVFRKRR